MHVRRRGGRKRPAPKGATYGKPTNQGINQLKYQRSLKSTLSTRPSAVILALTGLSSPSISTVNLEVLRQRARSLVSCAEVTSSTRLQRAGGRHGSATIPSHTGVTVESEAASSDLL